MFAGVAVLSNISLYRPVDLTPLPANFDPLTISTTATEDSDSEEDVNKSTKSEKLTSDTASLSLNPEGTDIYSPIRLNHKNASF